MSRAVEVDDQTYRALELAARMSGITPGEVVARLVDAPSAPEPASDKTVSLHTADGVEVYADYSGHRTRGRFDEVTSRIDITSGPLTGKSYKSPTGAARAVVGHYSPSISPSRNGWEFWMIADGSGRDLQAIRSR